MVVSPAPMSVTAPVVSFTVATSVFDEVYFTPSSPSGVTVSVGAWNVVLPTVVVAVSAENFSVAVTLLMVTFALPVTVSVASFVT